METEMVHLHYSLGLRLLSWHIQTVWESGYSERQSSKGKLLTWTCTWEGCWHILVLAVPHTRTGTRTPALFHQTTILFMV